MPNSTNRETLCSWHSFPMSRDRSISCLNTQLLPSLVKAIHRNERKGCICISMHYWCCLYYFPIVFLKIQTWKQRRQVSTEHLPGSIFCIHRVIYSPFIPIRKLVWSLLFQINSSLRKFKKFIPSHTIYKSKRSRFQILVCLTLTKTASSHIEYFNPSRLKKFLFYSHTPQMSMFLRYRSYPPTTPLCLWIIYPPVAIILTRSMSQRLRVHWGKEGRSFEIIIRRDFDFYLNSFLSSHGTQFKKIQKCKQGTSSFCPHSCQ